MIYRVIRNTETNELRKVLDGVRIQEPWVFVPPPDQNSPWEDVWSNFVKRMDLALVPTLANKNED